MGLFIGLAAPNRSGATVVASLLGAVVPVFVLRSRPGRTHGGLPSWAVVAAMGAATVLAIESDVAFAGPIVAVVIGIALCARNLEWGTVSLRIVPIALLALAIRHDADIEMVPLVVAVVAGFALAAYLQADGDIRVARRAGLLVLALALIAMLLISLLPPQGQSSQSAGHHPALRPAFDLDREENVEPSLLFLVEATAPERWRMITFTDFDGRYWSLPDFDPVSDTDRTDEVVSVDRVTVFEYRGIFLPASPTPFRAESEYVDVFVDDNGTVITNAVLEPGSTIEIFSWQRPVTPAGLRASDRLTTRMPPLIAPLAEAPTSTSDRVVALANEITADAVSNYDRVLELETYLSQSLRLSDGATPPEDERDRIDWLLFDTKHGRASQINTALVVMARSVGIPARLVAGFEPTIRDPRSGDWMLFEENLRVWAEVWFPGTGWVPFDPAASADPRANNSSPSSLVIVVIGAVVLALIVLGILIWLRRHRHSDQITTATPSDERRSRAVARLEALAINYEISVAPPSTLLELGAALSTTELSTTEIATVAAHLDRDRYGAELSPDEWAGVEQALDEAAAIAYRPAKVVSGKS